MNWQTEHPLRHRTIERGKNRANGLVESIKNGEIDLSPPYQRGDVWTQDQRIGLVYSWLVGLDTGTIVLAERSSDAWAEEYGDPYETGLGIHAVIDGKQRLTTATQWFSGQLAVPASWFQPDDIHNPPHDTPDGPYITHNDLTEPRQRLTGHRALFNVTAVRPESLAEEAAVYLIVNTSGTAQTPEDLTRAARAARE